MDENPAARALLVLQLVQTRPGITAAEIGERLGVSDRAARRYVATLRAADIPIDSVPGPGGGYRPGRGLRPPPLLFSSEEALALVMTVLERAPEADDPARSALDKLLRALPEASGSPARAMSTGASAAPDRYASHPRADLTAALVQASAERRRAEIEYRTEAGREFTSTVEPWSVVVRHGLWYLLCGTDRGPRAYRIDRVLRVVETDERFDPPDDLEPVTYLEQHLGSGWEHEVEVRVDAPVEIASRWLPRTMGRLEASPDGDANACRLVGSTSNVAGYAADLAHLPVAYRVLGDEGLRVATRELGEQIAAAAAP